MIIQQERLNDCTIKELDVLGKEHYKEIATFKDIPLNINWDVYVKMQDNNQFMMFTARDDTGTLSGYLIYLIVYQPHYKDSLSANQDVFYLKPELRGKMTGIRLLKRAEQELKARGVEVIFQHVKVKHDFSKLLERQGYSFTERIMTKRLG